MSVWENISKRISDSLGVTESEKVLQIAGIVQDEVSRVRSLDRGDSLYSFFFSKQPPNSPETEESVLSGFMDEPSVALLEVEKISPEAFYSIDNRLIFESQLSLAKEGKLTRSTLVDHLSQREYKGKPALDLVGGPSRIADLEFGSTSGEVRAASKVLVDFYQKRLILKTLFESVSRLQKSPVEDTTELNAKLVESLTAAARLSYTEEMFATSHDLRMELFKFFEMVYKFSQEGVDPEFRQPTFSKKLNDIVGGWYPTDFIIIAARPGMGKTSFILADARAAVESGLKVAIFSLEMSKVELAQRLFYYDSEEVTAQKVRAGELEEYHLPEVTRVIESIPDGLYIDDKPVLDILTFRSKVAKLVREYGVQRVYVDYLQLMTGSGGSSRNREQEISAISRGMKVTAKLMNVPIVALSQLSRAVEVRGGTKRPQLSDLRESGSLEQDADVVGFLYRPEYYQILEDEEGNSLKGLGDVIIAKQRRGPTGAVRLNFLDTKSLWYDDTGKDKSDVKARPKPDVQIRRSTWVDDSELLGGWD